MVYDDKTGLDFPIFQSDLAEMFGDPNDADFQQDYLRTLDLSEYAKYFRHVRDYEGNQWGLKIYCNYVMHDPLRRAFDLLVSMGLSSELKTYDGCFNIRKMKGGSGYSVHSWGLAVDFNVGTNPYGGEPSLSDDFVKCFSLSGFEWGGLWSTPDGMHFQLPWIKDRGNANPLFPVAWVA